MRAALVVAVDHRRGGALRPRRGGGGDPEQPEGVDRGALALDRQRARSPRPRPRARPGDRCRAPSRISPAGAACSSRAATLTASPVVNEPPSVRLPVVASPVLSPIRTRSWTPRGVADLAAGLAHVERRPRGAQRVVLVRDRDAEHRHHAVAAVVLDRAAVPLDGLAHAVEPALHRPAQRLRVDPLAERRRAHDVGEDDRDDLAPLLHGRRRQPRAARGTEPRALRHRPPAAPTRLHGATLALRGSDPLNNFIGSTAIDFLEVLRVAHPSTSAVPTWASIAARTSAGSWSGGTGGE